MMTKTLAQTEQLLKALSDANRLRILLALQQGEWCVCELSYALELAQSTLSTHLQALRQAELVATRRQGKWIYYRLHPDIPSVLHLLLTALKRELEGEPRVVRDSARLQHCLQVRQGGCCVMGFRFAPIRKEGGDGSCDATDS
ncbi:MAG: metalloregulator ArsR/SmtB family transcription factor [Armatimonadetes bacterium]|nr:metalloregulator ArsR/SmtB family transcription factor [Armatimonadota bacterium]CUU35591.1 DNA-binding transcriptional regulator, ArsR family [Armatimonadetes bacterium DC]